jgi:hypothetical protein
VQVDLNDAVAPEPEPTDLGRFVERLTEEAVEPQAPVPADPTTAAAVEQVRARIAAGEAPAGLRRLAEALVETGSERVATPAPRVPADDDTVPFTDVVAGARAESLLVLDGHGPEEVAAAVGALAAAGLRVAVTAADPALLEAVPGTVAGLPDLTVAEQRELRLLLATATPERRARAGAEIPPPPAWPSADEVRVLCAHAASSGGRSSVGPHVLRDVLNTLDEQRLAAVTEVAREARRALDDLGHRTDSWAWPLVGDLVHGLHRQAFDALRVVAAHSLSLADAARDLPRVTLAGDLPPDAAQLLAEYRDHLETGGRVRRHFRTGVQREVQPILALVRVGGVIPADPESVRAVVLHLELAGALTGVDAGCRELAVPAPHAVADLRALVDGLERVDHAVQAVGRLRHDVLFLHPSSPVQVPDLAAAEAVAAGIMDVAEHGSAPEAAARLDAFAAALAGTSEELVVEHRAAVEALRARDPEAYAVAVEALVPARRQAADQARCDALLARLRADDAALARAWADGRLGFVWVVPLESVLARIPAPDRLDAVVVLGAAELSVERLLVAAAAPRLLAVVGPGARPADPGPTLLGVLERAEAKVVRIPREPDPEGRVVRLPTARRAS